MGLGAAARSGGDFHRLGVAVLAFMLAAPASEIRAGMGINVELWLAGGLLLGLATVYFAIVRRLKAEAERRWEPRMRCASMRALHARTGGALGRDMGAGAGRRA